MQFESPEVERRFTQFFHAQRVTQDRFFAATQLAIMALLALDRGPNALPPQLYVLLWATHAASAMVLALSLLPCSRYVAVRPYLLVVARLLYDLLCPYLVWQLAGAAGSSSGGKGKRDEDAGWAGFFLLWVTWSRWGSQLLMQAGHQLPFNTEAVLVPFGTLADMLNNRRLCRLLTEAAPEQRRSFFRASFTWLAGALSTPMRVLSAAPSGTCPWDGLGTMDGSTAAACGWAICTPAPTADGPGSSGGGEACGGTVQPGAAAAAAGPLLGVGVDHVSTCFCEGVFGLTQVLLSLALPLLLLGLAEVRARRQFAAAEQHRDCERQRASAPYLRARSGCPTDWSLSYDGTRLLVLLALIQFRLFLSLRFGNWQRLEWLVGSGSGSSVLSGAAAAAAAEHVER